MMWMSARWEQVYVIPKQRARTRLVHIPVFASQDLRALEFRQHATVREICLMI